MNITSDIAIIFITYTGLALFLSGFLLTRKEIKVISNVPSFASLNSSFSTSSSSNSYYDEATYRDSSGEDMMHLDMTEVENFLLEKYLLSIKELEIKPKRVFLFIIDALRKDFMTKDNFPLTFKLMASNASQSRLFDTFVADPPTVTSQRLQGMTTGSMPTFIELSANFDSAVVEEDNLIQQLYSAGKKMVMMGDDTWAALFPSQFTISLPFDSFNTLDLHSVDDGIISNLWQHYLQKDGPGKVDWDLFVAHFLGVDHIGHTHSAFHPLMRDKLRQLDELLSRVLKNLPEDAVLFMFGDHGMTDEGNHGSHSFNITVHILASYSSLLLFRRVVVVGDGVCTLGLLFCPYIRCRSQ